LEEHDSGQPAQGDPIRSYYILEQAGAVTPSRGLAWKRRKLAAAPVPIPHGVQAQHTRVRVPKVHIRRKKHNKGLVQRPISHYFNSTAGAVTHSEGKAAPPCTGSARPHKDPSSLDLVTGGDAPT
jgi:hypothetical protein